MPLVSVGISRSTQALEMGQARLWALLVGVNQYQDETLTDLRYSATDCQGLGEALSAAARGFPNKVIQIYHDLAPQAATLATVRTSLEKMAAAARPEDTVLFYFSGHGILTPNSQQAVLCLADTRRSSLRETGLGVQELLQHLDGCAARQQLIWLDACHSGDLSLRGARGDFTASLLDPTSHLVTVLRKRSTQGKGLYALLSCDQGQKSWEFPELGHGVFTYYLMRGLRGEAADSQGIIEADGLYRYVYQQTLQYIDKLNQQIGWINQQKRSSGDLNLLPEYPLQTPKRIVEGVGEIILGQRSQSGSWGGCRRALVVDGLSGSQVGSALAPALRQAGPFALVPWRSDGSSGPQTRLAVETCLGSSPQLGLLGESPLALLYLRGQIEATAEGEAWLVLGEARLSCSWLRQALRRAASTQQIVILDCPAAPLLADWVQDLQFDSQHGQCILAAASPAARPGAFAQALLEILTTTHPQKGLTAADLIAQLQTDLAAKGVFLQTWLSGNQSLIEILPARIGAEPLEPDVLDTPTAISEPPTRIQAPLTLAAEEFNRLETLLQELVGPIAPTLLRQALAHATSFPTLIETLKLYLPRQHQLEFVRQTLSSPTPQPNSLPPQPQARSPEAGLPSSSPLSCSAPPPRCRLHR